MDAHGTKEAPMLCIIVQYVVLCDPNDNNNLSYAIYFEPCPREPDDSAGFLLQFSGDLSRDVLLAFNTSRTWINPLSMAQTVCIQHIGWADPYSGSAITNECAEIPLATSSGDGPGQLPGQPPHNAAELINTATDKLIAAGVLMLHRENIRPCPVSNHGMNRDTFPGLVLWQKRVPVPVVAPDQDEPPPVSVVVSGRGDAVPVPVVAPGRGGMVHVTVVSSEGGGGPLEPQLRLVVLFFLFFVARSARDGWMRAMSYLLFILLFLIHKRRHRRALSEGDG